jgi:SAM-dependent methyltransferase
LIGRWWRLWLLARKRLESPESYRAFQFYQGRWLTERLQRLGVPLKDSLVLDLGAGLGGYSLALRAVGAKIVGLDLRPAPDLRSMGVDQVKGDALELPFRCSSFDGVFCASLIEHVRDQGRLLLEMRRVLKPGGWAYLSFPPYFSPLGGHQFSPFHYLGERIALAIARRRRWWGSSSWVPAEFGTNPASFADAFGAYGLYPVTIAKARGLIGRSGFEIRWWGTRFFPVNVARLPILGEFLSWHVEFLLQPAG